jgi:hypothetical protein
MVSPLSTRSSNANYSHDKKASKSMSTLTVRSNSTHQKGVCKFISAVNTTPLDLKDVNFVNCSYTNKYHLQVLLEKKVTTMTTEMKAGFAAMNFRSQLGKVNDIHSPSEMRMVYM